MLVQRFMCAIVVGVLHLFAGLELASLVPRSRTDVPADAARSTALRVSGFFFESSEISPQLASLIGADSIVSPLAIIVAPPSLPDMEPLAADSFARSRELASTEDAQVAARLQGLYRGQITSRLTRLLEDSQVQRPAEGRPCIVHVVQDEQGRVMDVMSDECEVSDEWREEIARAIYRSSPLPLPPSGLAMGSYLTLDLSSI